MTVSRRWALSDCRFVTRRRSNESRRCESASRVRPLARSERSGRVEPTDGVRAEGVCVVPIWRRDLSCSNRESRCKDELAEVDDLDSVGVSDPNCEREPNVERVEDLSYDLVWGTVVFVESLPIRVPMLRERDSSENDRMRELNVESVEDRVIDRVCGTAVFVDCFPISVPILCEFVSPDEDGVLGIVLGDR